ncbi:restriction endonuclease [Hyphomonas sp.]|uniref:restriction endonuclease n=1 Tax=Hyphomonas sp. TaxID=87 RepID=UPI0035296202
MDKKDFRKFEELVADIQSQLSPDSEVIHDYRIRGADSGVMRQIDVFVRGRIGQYDMRIGIDCKDYKKSVDVKKVEEFAGLIKDTRCHRGVLVSANGFSAAAISIAKNAGISLYRPVDTRDHKWRVELAAPAVFEFLEMAVSFQFKCSWPGPMRLDPNFFANTQIFDQSGNPLGTAVEHVIGQWKGGGTVISARASRLINRSSMNKKSIVTMATEPKCRLN